MLNLTIHKTIGRIEHYSVFFRVLTYLPLLIISLGLVSNMVCFCIFRFHKEFRNLSTMVYLSMATVADTLALFGWNLDHYLNYNHLVSIFLLNKPVCKLMIFNQFFSQQLSAILLGFMSFDRYVYIASMPGSFLSKLPFRTVKSAYIWCAVLTLITIAINSHIVIFSCYLIDKQPEWFNGNLSEIETFNRNIYLVYYYENGFSIFPTWERIHIIFSVLVPFLLMLISNVLILKKMFKLNSARKYQASSSSMVKANAVNPKKFSHIYMLIGFTVVFLLLTLPNCLVQTVFYNYFNKQFRLTLDTISYLNNISIFVLCFITNYNFRKIITSGFLFKKS